MPQNNRIGLRPFLVCSVPIAKAKVVDILAGDLGEVRHQALLIEGRGKVESARSDLEVRWDLTKEFVN